MVVNLSDTAVKISIKGIVQGVGFRPFVYRTAKDLGIKGWVNNTSDGVNIHAEGENTEEFLRRLVEEAPRLARIVQVERINVPSEQYEEFRILKSEYSTDKDTLISPDVATCKDCLKELFDQKDRRYLYPFINCTNCGPRYTIIKDRPYDRAKTTMSAFPMCESCGNEYQDPLDRRFHAQPVACDVCGPQIKLLNNKSIEINDQGLGTGLLEKGAIMAVKGLGGFHLVCDAANNEAVRRLRSLKERGSKPFAVMTKDLETAKKIVSINKTEEQLLLSPAAPIVILSKKAGSKNEMCLAEDVAPGVHTLGIMLPYTPIHHLLFSGSCDYLVMTSANLSGMPLIFENEQALEHLSSIADYFLLHNRDIFHPCDDSVVQIIADEPVFMRRARGYVPNPIILESNIDIPMAALGGEMKNAFCLAKDHFAFVSQYIGDMHGYENFERFKTEYKTFQDVANIYPQRIIYDMHPGYMTSKFAQTIEWPQLAVQHHHAHMVSAAGEQNLNGKVLGIICDGTGYGTDGKIWGFEFLYGDSGGFERKAHLEYLPLPGGDAGAKHPLRIAYAYLKRLFGQIDPEVYTRLFAGMTDQEKSILDGQLKSALNVFDTSSAGRFFDVVSSLLGICTEVTYEGQAAIELESSAWEWLNNSAEQMNTDWLQRKNIKDTMYSEGMDRLKKVRELCSGKETDTICFNTNLYIFEHSLQESLILHIEGFMSKLVSDIINGKSKGEIAYCFHLSIAVAILETVMLLGLEGENIVLSGGVFQNKLLSELLLSLARKLGIKIFRHKELPCGDGGIAFGQILIGQKQLNKAD